jgi:anti-sigma regulatory factor (Ser/Thr protein kinase)
MAASARDVPGAAGDPAGGGGLLLELEFAAGSLYLLRQAVATHAAAAGLGEARVRDVGLAVNELASNAVRHGAGRGRLRMWGQDGAVCCQVQDAGREPRGGWAGERGQAGAVGWPYARGHGLWLVRLLADQMSATSGPGGTCVTVWFARR